MKTSIQNVDAYPTHTDANGNTESTVVYRVNWTNFLSDESGNCAAVDGFTDLNTDNVSNITEFSLLTEAQVKEWVINDWGGIDSQEYLNKVQELQDKLSEMANPTSVKMLLGSCLIV